MTSTSRCVISPLKSKAIDTICWEVCCKTIKNKYATTTKGMAVHNVESDQTKAKSTEDWDMGFDSFKWAPKHEHFQIGALGCQVTHFYSHMTSMQHKMYFRLQTPNYFSFHPRLSLSLPLLSLALVHPVLTRSDVSRI